MKHGKQGRYLGAKGQNRVMGAWLLVALLLAATPASAEIASNWVDGLNSRVRLVAGAVTTGPGQPEGGFYAGVEISLAEGYKTYWRSPGDSGIPPQFNWSGSENITATQVLYPAPPRLPDPAGQSIGYKKKVMFPVWIKPAQAGRPVALKLTLDYAVCAELCIPAHAELALMLPTAMASTFGPAKSLQASLNKVPRPVEDAAAARVSHVMVDATASPPRLIIDVQEPGTGESDLFVEGPESWYLTLPEKTGGKDGKTRYTLPLDAVPKTARLDGTMLFFTLVRPDGAYSQSWRLHAPDS